MKKAITFRTSEDMLNRLREMAAYHMRSVNGELEHIMIQFVESHERDLAAKAKEQSIFDKYPYNTR